jgi:hypothetical protein
VRGNARGFAIGMAAGLSLVAVGVALAAGERGRLPGPPGDIQSVNSNVVPDSVGAKVLLTGRSTA